MDTPTPKSVALYARVSTKQHGQDPETQLQPLREFSRLRQYEIVSEYIDVGISGAKARRPELDRLMRDAKRHKFDVVLVWRFDRFARSVRHLLQALEEFNRLSIHFVSLSEAIDTSTPMGRLVFVIIAAIAELERDIIRERVQAGVDRARRQGKQLGRPRRIVDRERVRSLADSGLSLRQISLALKLARATIKTALLGHVKNPLAEAK